MKKKLIHALIAILAFPLALSIGVEIVLIYLPCIEIELAVMALATIVGMFVSAVYTHQFVKDFYS